MDEYFLMDEFMQRPRTILIQCSHRSITERCPNPAIAYIFKPQHILKDPAPALCASCCVVAIERSKDGEQLVFQRIKNS